MTKTAIVRQNSELKDFLLFTGIIVHYLIIIIINLNIHLLKNILTLVNILDYNRELIKTKFYEIIGR